MSNIQTGAERMPHDLSHLGFLAGQIGRLITISTTPVIAGDSFEMDAVGDRKSGSAGMPRPISYAVFCLKKKNNYFYGITAIRFWPYVLISAIGMLPGTLLYAYLGAVGKASLAAKSPPSVWRYLLLGDGLGATLAVTIIITRISRNALNRSGASNTER